MPFKQFSDDEVLSATNVNRFFVQQYSVIKPSDETLVSNASIQNDDHLIVPLLANTQYFIEFFIIYDAVQAADIKIGWNYPAGTTMDWTHGGLGTSTTSTVFNVSRQWRDSGDLGTIGGPNAAAGTLAVIPGEGRLTTVGTAGNLTFQWCQNTSNAIGTVVKAYSCIIAQRLTV